MTSIHHRFATLLASAAAFGMVATPAAALDLPHRPQAVKVYDGDAANADHSRRYRHRRHRDRDNGIGTGDVIAGLLVLGSIAAIAASADSDSRDDRERYPDDGRYDDARYDGNGMDNAVDICVAEVERSRGLVGDVEDASRTGQGWFVSGVLDNGAPWTCRIDNNGRVSGIEAGDRYGGGTAYAPPAGVSYDRQYDDATYARARAAARSYAVGY